MNIPKILVQGKWLNDLGYSVGDFYVKHNLSAMEKLFAGYVKARLDRLKWIVPKRHG